MEQTNKVQTFALKKVSCNHFNINIFNNALIYFIDLKDKDQISTMY